MHTYTHKHTVWMCTDEFVQRFVSSLWVCPMTEHHTAVSFADIAIDVEYTVF